MSATQVVTGTHLSGAGTPPAGRAVKATPLPGQHIDALTVDNQVLTAQTDEAGEWSLTLLCGVTYDVKIDRWGVKTITVTSDAEKEFTTYLDANAALGGRVAGSIRTATGEDVMPVVELDPEGNYMIGWRVV